MEDDEVTTTTQVAFCEVVSSNVDQGAALSEISDSSVWARHAKTHEQSI